MHFSFDLSVVQDSCTALYHLCVVLVTCVPPYMQIAAVNREIYDVIVFAVDRLTIRASICSGDSGVLHLMVYKCLDDFGQRPIIIIIPIDSHCNLPQNKTHPCASQLIVVPNIFSRRKIAPRRVQVLVQPKNRGLASIQGRYFSLFRDTTKSLNNEKNDYSKITTCAI